MKIKGGKYKLTGTYTVPGDKSISHRSVMLGALAEGTTSVSGFLTGEDCLATIACFQMLGVDIQQSGTQLTIQGGNLTSPKSTLDVGNSGTTLRLIAGILAGQAFDCMLTGDESIQKRPMKRVVDPLTQMGADISGIYAPITIKGRKLKGIEYTLPIASAQIKSAILLAGLFADGETIINEPVRSRDHTEIMLAYLDADIRRKDERVIYRPSKSGIKLKAQDITVPGDVSSAAFLMVAATILPGSDIVIENVGVNPTRTGIINVLRRMGADIKLLNERSVCGEKVANIAIRHSLLRATEISGSEIPTLIDEIPIIAVAALFAEGETVIKNAEELRVKETDRIQAVVEEFSKFNFNFLSNGQKPILTPCPDGMVIKGGHVEYPIVENMDNKPQSIVANSRGDHRLAMSLAILALGLGNGFETTIKNSKCVDISFPGFYQLLPCDTMVQE